MPKSCKVAASSVFSRVPVVRGQARARGLSCGYRLFSCKSQRVHALALQLQAGLCSSKDCPGCPHALCCSSCCSLSTDGLHHLLMKLLYQRMHIRRSAMALQPFWVLFAGFLENEALKVACALEGFECKPHPLPVYLEFAVFVHTLCVYH